MKPQPTPNQPPTEAVFLSPDDPLVQLLARVVRRILTQTSSTEAHHDQSRNLCPREQRTTTR